MTPNAPDEPQPQVIIPDAVMHQLKDLTPEQLDGFAQAVQRVRADPSSARPLVPHPVDYTDPARNADLPRLRTPLRLRTVVATISPPTLAVYDAEWQEDTSDGGDRRLRGAVQFMIRWMVYGFIQGQPDRAARWREAERCEDPHEAANRIAAMMSAAYERIFPLAREGTDLSPYTEQTAPGCWLATDPTLELTDTGPSAPAALAALRGSMTAVLFPLEGSAGGGG